MNKKTVVFLTDFDFENPYGAGWNRVFNYAKALAKVNVESLIVSSKYRYATLNSINVYQKNISLLIGEKVSYKSTFEDFHFKRYYKFQHDVHRLCKRKVETRFFLYNSNMSSVAIALFYLILFKREKTFIEKNELQTAIALNIHFKSGSFIKDVFGLSYKILRIITGFITDFISVFFSGIIAISTRFSKLYKMLNKRVAVIPILIDSANSDEKSMMKEDRSIFKIGYFGHISEEKDGVVSLIKAVKKTNEFSKRKVQLHMYGSLATYKVKYFNNLIDQKQIFYHEKIPSYKVGNELIKYDLLSLVRPKNLQTQFGFSTKLGEYLLSGVPVLTSDISDNKVYLEDNVNSFIVIVKKQIQISSLISKINEVINIKQEQLRKVGLKGKDTSLKYFDYKNYSKKIYYFFWKHD